MSRPQSVATARILAGVLAAVAAWTPLSAQRILAGSVVRLEYETNRAKDAISKNKLLGRKNVVVFLITPPLPHELEGSVSQKAMLRVEGEAFEGIVTQKPSRILEIEIHLERAWAKRIYSSGILDLDFTDHLLRYSVPTIVIDPIAPRPLQVTTSAETGDRVRFQAIGSLPADVVALEVCTAPGAYLRLGETTFPVAGVQANVGSEKKKTIEVEVAKPVPQGAELVLELCSPGSADRWVYREVLPASDSTQADTRPSKALPLAMVRVEEEAGPRFVLWIEHPPKELAQGAKAEIVAAEPSNAISVGWLNFLPGPGGRLVAQSSGAAELQRLFLRIQGDRVEYRLEGVQPLQIRSPTPRLGATLAWAILALAVAEILGFWWILRAFRRVRDEDGERVMPESLTRVTVTEAVGKALERLLPPVPPPGGPPSAITAPDGEDRGQPASAPSGTVAGTSHGPHANGSFIQTTESRLLRLVNQWWAEDRSRSRDRLFAFGRQHGFANLQLHESTKLDENLSRLTDRRYSFRTTDRALEWIFCRSGIEVLALPLDERFFEAGQALRLIDRLFDGVDTQAKSARFERADKACRLEELGDGYYRLKERGRLQLAGSGTVPKESGHADTPRLAEPPEPGAARLVLERSLLETLEQQSRELGRQIAEVRGLLATIQGQLVTPNLFKEGLEHITRAIQSFLTQHGELPLGNLLAGEVEKRIDTLGEMTVWPQPGGARAAGPLEPLIASVNEGLTPERQRERDNFERELEDSLPSLPLVTSHVFPEFGPDEYLKALDRATATLSSRMSNWRIGIFHFVVRSLGLHDCIELHRPRGSVAGGVECTCGYLAEDYLYQLALGIEKPAGMFLAMLVPRGCRMDHYGKGYTLLLNGRLPDGGRQAQTTKAVILQRVEPGGRELYEVIKPMEVIFE